jgi:DNA invertase Pin-like site-specific DNA recombinase
MPLGKTIFGMVGVMAEFERELIRERVTAGMRHARLHGIHVGAAPRSRRSNPGSCASEVGIRVARDRVRIGSIGGHAIVGTLFKKLR